MSVEDLFLDCFVVVPEINAKKLPQENGKHDKILNLNVCNIKNGNIDSLSMTYKTDPHKRVTTLAVHPFTQSLFTGCSDGSIQRWCLKEKTFIKF